MRARSLPLGLHGPGIARLRLAEPTTHGVLIRFTSQGSDPSDSAAGSRPRDRVIDLFIPDVVPLTPYIIALLGKVPQVSQAQWDLLEPSLRRRAAASHRWQAVQGRSVRHRVSGDRESTLEVRSQPLPPFWHLSPVSESGDKQPLATGGFAVGQLGYSLVAEKHGAKPV